MEQPTIFSSRKEIKDYEKWIAKQNEDLRLYLVEEEAQEQAEEEAERKYNARVFKEEQEHLKKSAKYYDKNYYNAHCDDENWVW